MTELKKRRLGRTELQVTELGLGGFQFTGEFGVPRSVANDIMELAFKSGINFVDCAPMYGFGESEELVGRGMEKTGEKIFVSTKVGWLDRTIVRNLGDKAYTDEDSIRRVIQHSMRLIGRNYLDILMIHEPEWSQWELDPVTGNSVVLKVLEELKDEGVIGAIGIGGGHLGVMTELIETGRIDVVLTFMHYDLAVQDAKDSLLPAAQKHDTGVILGGPFRQGALAVKQEDRIKEMRRTKDYPWGFNEEVVRKIDNIYRLSDDANIPLAEMGIRYLLSDPQIGTIIPGPRKVSELKANLEAARKGPLPEDILRELKSISSKTNIL